MNPTGMIDRRERKREQGLDAASCLPAVCRGQRFIRVHLVGQRQMPVREYIG